VLSEIEVSWRQKDDFGVVQQQKSCRPHRGNVGSLTTSPKIDLQLQAKESHRWQMFGLQL
jgi:hypothetical protein